MSMLPASLAMNLGAQRVLAQSVNLSYAGRGAYRVHETEPDRKGDYWFRDFGMVMACTYMTELGFRGTERYYTMPLLTNALELHALRSDGHGQKRAIPFTNNGVQQLGSTKLYPHALNYTDMPDALRQKMMGTLIRNSSDLVPQVLEKDALAEIDKAVASKDNPLDEKVAKDLKQVLQNPMNPENEGMVNSYLQKRDFTDEVRSKLTNLSRIDNQVKRETAITQFLAQNAQSNQPKLDGDDVRNAVRMLQARQTGYLVHHLDRTLNFQHHLEHNYLKPKPEAIKHGFEMPVALRRKNIYSPVSELGEVISERLNSYAEKLHNLQGSAKGKLKDAAFKVRQLPLEKREEEFNKLIHKIDELQLLSKKESLIDFYTAAGLDVNEQKEIQAIYEQLALNHENNTKRSLQLGDLKKKSAEFGNVLETGPKEAWTNWQADYYKKRGALQKFLCGEQRIPKKDLEKQLQHFDGFFEQMNTKQAITQYQLQKLYHHLGADLLVQIKKKIKEAAAEINKIPDEMLPKLTNADRLATKAELMKARLKDIGLANWLKEEKINDLGEALVQPLENQRWERYANEGVMEKVKREIFGELTAYSKKEGAKSGDKGALFDLLCSKKPGEGIEKLLKPLLNEKNLHLVEEKVEDTITRQPNVEWTIKSLIFDGMQSKTIKSAVDKIQRNGTWPKMAATVGLNFIFYGWLASRFDNKILQPYEEKLVARKGTSQDIVNAGYLGTIPGVAALSQLFDKASLPVFKRMNHFTRFASVGGVALAAFAGSTYGFLRLLDKTTPALPSATPQGKPENTQTNQSANVSPHPIKPTQPTFVGNPTYRPFTNTQPFQHSRPFAPQPFNRPAQASYSPFYPRFKANEQIEA